MASNDGNTTSVVAAFEMLLEEVEAEIDLINRLGARAFEFCDYDRARDALERAGLITAFRDKTDALRKEWNSLARSPASEAEDEESQTQRRNLGRLARGLRTREEAYYRPILETLEELGGSAAMQQVLERVEQVMRSTLKKVDYDPLASDPNLPRWKNTGQWARNSMVKEGLLKDDSPRGIWEISENGRRWLSEEQ